MSIQLSVLLVTDSLAAIATVLERYRVATDPACVELVVAAVAGADVTAPALAAAGFPHHRIVDGGDGVLRTAEWRAVQAATAPLVVFAQAHAFPRPGFGAAVLAAHAAGSWAVIGPAMANANPATLASRVAMWFAYGRWMDGPPRGPAPDVAGHNSAYDRAALRALGDDLASLLEAGWQLQVELAARGRRCFLEPAACVEIVNPSTLPAFLAHAFHLGRAVAAKRSRRWSAPRRWSYALGAPLIPLVRLGRIVADGVRRDTHVPWRGLPLLTVGLAASAAGELAGFLRGPGPPSRFVRKA